MQDRARSAAPWCRVVILATLLAAVPSLAAAAASKLKSGWKTNDIVVDGRGDEWTGATTFFKKENLDVGVVNDGEFLYVTVQSTDQATQRQVMMQGLVVWLDSRGGKKETFGVRYPIGLRATGALQKMRGGEDGPPDREERQRIFAEAFQNLFILGPGNESQEIAVSEAAGVEVMMNTVEGKMVYELRVPLQATDGRPYAVGTEAGNGIGIGVVTPKMERPAGARQRGAPASLGAGGGSGGGGFGSDRVGGDGSFGGGGPRPGGGGSQPKPLKLWTTIELASVR